MNLLDRAERRFGHLAIPHLLHGIAFLSAFAFVIFKLNPQFFTVLELYPERVMAGEVWRLITYLFVPTICSLLPFPDWINAAVYVMFMIWVSNGLDEAMGPFKVNVYCLLTVLGITIAAFFFGTTFSHLIFVQAVFFAFARFYPDAVINLYYILPVKVKWMAWLDAAWLLYQFTFYPTSFRMALLAALSSYLLFFGQQIFQDARHRQEVGVRRRRFETAVHETDGEAMHTCATCGRTDLAHPELEFRVSRDGQEYCVEHLPKASPPPTPPAT